LNYVDDDDTLVKVHESRTSYIFLTLGIRLRRHSQI